ncbi:hypothetical protein GY45DRAFT_1170091 [Cubamyces sp. BRFM 1775]|nr:hypothetical protein GY45DRAFT_1170091 [Cubamyces sp. BRFM 1775]
MPSLGMPSSSSATTSAASVGSTIVSASPDADRPEPSSNQKHTVVVAVAAVCGALGALAIVLALAYYRLRKRYRSHPATSQAGPGTRALASQAVASGRSQEVSDLQPLSLVSPPHVEPVDVISSSTQYSTTKSPLDTDSSLYSSVFRTPPTLPSPQTRTLPSPPTSDRLQSIDERDPGSRTYVASQSTLLETTSMYTPAYTESSRPPSYHESA